MSIKKINCKECGKVNTCDELCNKALGYADQDEVKLKEKTIGLPMYGEKIQEMETPSFLTFREKQVYWLWRGGFSRKDISQTLDITRKALRFHIFNINSKMQSKFIST